MELVGREETVGRIEHHLATGRTATVMVYGPAGVGRSAVLSALCDRFDGPTIRVTASDAAATLPLGVLGPLLPDHRSDELAAAGDPERRLRAVARHLATQAIGSRLLVGIDDAHKLDPLSLALVRHLTDVEGLVLVLTLRSESVVAEELTSLWRSGTALRVDLELFDPATADELLTVLCGGPLDPHSAAELRKLAGGSPLLLNELVHAAREQGCIRQEAGRWRLTDRLQITGRLLALATPGLDDLHGGARAAMLALTLVEGLGFEVLLQLVGPDVVADLEADGAIAVETDQRHARVWLTRPLDGEILRRTTPHAQLLQLADRLLDGLGSHGEVRRDDVRVLAELWQLAARPSRPELFVAAARHAMAEGDLVGATQLGEVAVARQGGFDAHLVLGQALVYRGHGDPSEAALVRADQLASSDEQVAAAALIRLHVHLFVLGAPAVADRILAEARSRVVAPGPQDELDGARAMCALFRGDLVEAVAAGSAVLARHDPAPTTLLGVLVVTTLAHALSGDVEPAQAGLIRAEPLIVPLRDALPLAGDQLGITRLLALMHDARLRDALALAGAHYRQLEAVAADGSAGAWATGLGLALAEAGRFVEAEEILRRACVLLGPADPLGMSGTALAIHARCLVAIGDLTGARARLVEVAGRTQEDHRTQMHAGRARVWLAGAAGEVETAGELAVQVGERAIDAGLVMWGSSVFHDAVRFGSPQHVRASLVGLGAEHDAKLLQLYAVHAEATDERDLPGLQDLAERFRAAGFDLYAAEVYAQLARLADMGGHKRAARRAATLADSLARAHELPATPALQLVVDELTPREREVALMARDGATSRSIAAKLVLSVRTVDNYLAAVYRKTGVASRQELAAVLVDDPPAGCETA